MEKNLKMAKNSMSVSQFKKEKRISENEIAFESALKRYGPDLPAPVREYVFMSPRKWRFDFAWPDLKVAVECDGIIHQASGGRHNSDSDKEKLNAAAGDGWMVLRFSGKQIFLSPWDCISLLKMAFLKKNGGLKWES